MAKDNRLWGAERIRGELLKLGLRVCKRTIQQVHEDGSLTAVTRPEVEHISAQPCRTDLGVRRASRSPICSFDRSQAFFIIELKSRKVIHVGVTRSPTDAWVAQHLREATLYGLAPKYLIRDNDRKFGPCFARVAPTSGIKILKTPYHAPRANAVCERFLRSVRRACLDHLLILQEKQHEPRAPCVCGLLQPSTTPGSASSSRSLNLPDQLIPLITEARR